MVFRVESTQLDRTFRFNGSQEVYELCETARFRQRGIPPELVEKAREVVLINGPWLDHSRLYALGKTWAGSPPPGHKFPDY